jgi:regulator of protease activity HflC (stomatin/prohibitin superfamily)
MFTRIIKVKLNERVVLFRDSLPIRALAPGRYRLFGRGLSEQRFSTEQLVFAALPEVIAMLPKDWYTEATLGARERGVLYREGRPRMFLRPGTHRFWTVDPSVKLAVFSVDAPMPELTDELLAILPKGECTIGYVAEHQRGLKYVQGRLDQVLDPGRYAFWSYPEAAVTVQTVDMRRDQVAIVGQELMTRDKVTLRLSLTLEYSVADPARAAHAAANLKDVLYLVVQLATRQFVAGVTLDELLEGRDAMARYLQTDAEARTAELGVRIERVGLKDIVLPGEMKTLLNRVIEAEKEAAANVILRREETAATRSLANTARVMAENPILLRLKELEALKEMAAQIDEVRLVVGSDGLDKLVSAELLTKPRS